jgi:5'-deoxynucleotidase YfbR-like HD superfamily hydrolase
MSGAWIETYSGLGFDILETRPEMIQIEDIAHALSQMNRFTGHCRFPYPVAQHCLLGSYLIHSDFALAFLLHDASEAYMGDMNRPLKHFTKAGTEYRIVEAKIQTMIYMRFGCPVIEPVEVKDIDNQMLYAEKAQLMTGLPWTTKWSNDERAASVEIIETSFRDNKRLYLERFNELYKSQS